MLRPFTERLAASERRAGTVLCVGLDPDPGRFPTVLCRTSSRTTATVEFCREIIAATAGLAAAYKINFAFFEALGDEAFAAVRRVRNAIPTDIPVIADAKRADIGNSARFYAAAVFDELGFDAITVSPYMGFDSVEPFLERADRAAFVLARTSNPGARDFQDLEAGGVPVYLHVARAVRSWAGQTAGTAGLVAGATERSALAALRLECPDLPFLVPGVGAQGGDPREAVGAAWAGPGTLVVGSSRAILYASPGPDFARAAADAARAAAAALRPPAAAGAPSKDPSPSGP